MNVPTTSVPGLLSPQEVERPHRYARAAGACQARCEQSAASRTGSSATSTPTTSKLSRGRRSSTTSRTPSFASRPCISTTSASAPRPTASTAISAFAIRASAAASRIRTARARSSRKPTSIATSRLTRRAMESLGVDYMVVFPTSDAVSRHASTARDGGVARPRLQSLAVDKLLSARRPHQVARLPPFNTPDEAERAVEEFGDAKGVIGFCVTSTRYKPVHHNDYMRLYSMIQETGKPVAFHAGYHWQDRRWRPSTASSACMRSASSGATWCT